MAEFSLSADYTETNEHEQFWKIRFINFVPCCCSKQLAVFAIISNLSGFLKIGFESTKFFLLQEKAQQ